MAFALRHTAPVRPKPLRTQSVSLPNLSRGISTNTSSKTSRGSMTSSSKTHLRSPRSRRQTRSVHIVGTGSYVPDRLLTNADLEKMVDTTDDWIVTRTGIKERRIAADYQCTSDLGAEASRRAMNQAGV